MGDLIAEIGGFGSTVMGVIVVVIALTFNVVSIIRGKRPWNQQGSQTGVPMNPVTNT